MKRRYRISLGNRIYYTMLAIISQTFGIVGLLYWIFGRSALVTAIGLVVGLVFSWWTISDDFERVE